MPRLELTLCYRDSLAEIERMVEEAKPALANTFQRTQSLPSSHPQISVPDSIYSREDREDDEVEEYASSIWSDRDFDFNDLIVNSKVYCRALAAARASKQLVDEDTHETREQIVGTSNDHVSIEGDLTDLSDAATITQKTPHAHSMVLGF